MQDIVGKTAFVTGAASGIGLAISKRFLAAGANVMMADNNADALSAAQSDLGGNSSIVICDVANPKSVRSAADQTIQEFGKVHIIVNNAGVSLAGRPGETPLQDWRWMIDINLMGVVHGVEIFTPLILSHGEGGHFINTASMAGHLAAPSLGPYTASKFAVVGYSETIQKDLEPKGIGVSILCPAWVKTGIADAHRNRPSNQKNDPNDADAAAALKAVETGINPSLVADWTYDCMMANRLYIFTHPEFHRFVEMRNDQIDDDYQAAAADPRLAKIP